MLSYALPDAAALLSSKLSAAERNRQAAIQVRRRHGYLLSRENFEPETFFLSALSTQSAVFQDLEFLREQITVMEVNTARVYNWDVRRRRERRQRGEVDESRGGQ